MGDRSWDSGKTVEQCFLTGGGENVRKKFVSFSFYRHSFILENVAVSLHSGIVNTPKDFEL